jgi:hypothetical protein
VREKLLDWYDTHHRILPWRRNPHSKLDPAVAAAAAAEGRTGAALDMPLNQFIYSVWVCEVMSQQTQVLADALLLLSCSCGRAVNPGTFRRGWQALVEKGGQLGLLKQSSHCRGSHAPATRHAGA